MSRDRTSSSFLATYHLSQSNTEAHWFSFLIPDLYIFVRLFTLVCDKNSPNFRYRQTHWLMNNRFGHAPLPLKNISYLANAQGAREESLAIFESK